MRLVVLFSFMLLSLQSFGQPKDWSMASLDQLDAEQFRRLEKGEKAQEEIPKLIIQKTGKQPSKYLINAYTVLGIINKNRGYYVSSLNYHLLALSAAERLKDKGRISACLNNIGTLYLLQENYPKAIVFFDRSLKEEEKLQNPEQKSIRLYNLGDAYKRQGQLDEAMGYFTASLLIERKLNNSIGIAYALLGQADVYLLMNRQSDLDATVSSIQVNALDVEGQLEFYRIKGKGQLLKGNSSEAIQQFNSGIQLAHRSASKTQLAELYLLMAQSYDHMKAVDQANIWYKKHIEVYKSLQSNLIKNQLEDLTYQNELQQKEYKIVYLKQQQELAKTNIQAQKALRSFDWRIVIFSICSVVGIALTVVFGIKKLVNNS